ncbi:maltokinase N-terminal cap-like domain-containing protein [Streptomyces heilongjiangensis]|uniref:1,4-alpha-glucan branching protein n=1 Tax=Streptomyces heilongjiangensis TaxID=945052 RepID=A0ABW1B3B8_9ACTN|nr:1,4-alpha-glucan branching protein [Streptomyces heilongjiangensis]MDC2946853.1 1,4-alpha-glucan branching protein [Streptomyces heilongjiangensis]
MAIIHRTTLTPTKLELLTAWLPGRPWYRGGAGEPRLARAGGFRLDDPAGEVGIEFMVATDTSGPEPVHYLAPLTYRGAPLDGGEHALVGTTEHGVLGTRWVYDGCHDPVLVAELLALFEGRAQAQAQSLTDTPDHAIVRSCAVSAPLSPAPAGDAPCAEDGGDATAVAVAPGLTLRLHRVLRAAPDTAADRPEGAAGHVSGHWDLPDGSRARAVFAVLHG